MSTASSLPLKTRRPPILNSPLSVSIPPSHHDDHHNTNNGSPPSPSSNTKLSLWGGFFQTPYHHHRSSTTVVAWFKGQSGKRICFRKIWTDRKVKLCTIFQIVTKDLTDMISLAPWKDNPYQGLMWLTRELAGQTVFSLLTVLSDLSMTNGKDKWKLRSCSVVTCDSF
ncbi:hypothetical protein L2E82_30863 [Cichorium intybus]|uniref:Uncharacterized protein n=1 Tax=Cichorium intybus TaxID=13427 RepID=A0ACB9D1J4_CICIN|nr:hypothetical protein L2E82_30863 [Cichorium intybus]